MYLALSFRFLVLEHVSGGELFDHLVKRGRLPLGEVTCLNYILGYYISLRLYFTVQPTKFKSLF